MNLEQRREVHSLMVRFADGERAAFEALFERLWPLLLAFTTRTLPTQADAEDAAQQTLLKVFSRIVDFDRTRDGVSWTLAIAAFEVMTVRKQRTRRREELAGSIGPTADLAPNQEERLVSADLRDAAISVLGELSDRDRSALDYLLADERPATDDTSRKRRLRALERLRAAWRRVHG